MTLSHLGSSPFRTFGFWGMRWQDGSLDGSAGRLEVPRLLEENTVPALLLCPFTSTKIELPHLQLEWFFNQARQTYIRRKLIKILPLSSCSNIILSKSLMHKRSTMTQDSDPFLVWLPGQPDLTPRIQGPLFTGRAGLNHSV